MQKTLFITTIYPPDTGGIELCLHNIIKRLPHNKAVVLTRKAASLSDFDKTENYPIYRRSLEARFLRPRWLFSPILAFKVALKEKVGSVQAAHGFASYFSAFWLHKLLGLPYFVWAYGLDILSMQKSPLISWWVRRIYAQAQGGIANSNFTKELMIQMGLEASGVRVVYPGVQSDNFKPDLPDNGVLQKYNIPKGKNILLSVSRLVSRKGFDLVIRALPEILKKFPNTLYLIGGRGPDARRLRALTVKNPRVGKAVRFLDFIPECDLASLYNLASIFLMPSRFIEGDGDVEGFGMVFLEAGACECPVIGGRSGGIPEAIIDGKTGFLVDPKDPRDLRDKVIMLLGDSQLRKRVGQAARKRVVLEFNWDKIVGDFVRAVDELIR